MAAVLMRLRADCRRRRAGLLGIVVLLGIAGGVVMTAAAGARRTHSTLQRVTRTSHASDVLVNPDVPVDEVHWDAIDHIPGASHTAFLQGLFGGPLDANGNFDLRSLFVSVVATPTDGRMFGELEAPRLTHGRYPRLDAPNEMVVSDVAARKYGLHVGQDVQFGWASRADAVGQTPPAHPRFITPMHITGVVVTLDDVARAADDPRLSPSFLISPAFVRAHPDVGIPYAGKYVRLERGTTPGEFEARVRDELRVPVTFQERTLTEQRVNRAIRPYVVALWLFAALAAVAAAGVIGQIITRGIRSLRDERATLEALGMSRRHIVFVGALRALLVGLAGAAIALVVAYVASTTMPIGPMRGIDPARGRQADGVVFAVGALTIAGFATVVGMSTMLSRPRIVRNRASVRVGNDLARAGASVPVASGVRFALDRGPDGSVPLRSTLVGVVVAVMALVTTLVFATGLERFTSTPQRYGWPWSIQIDNLSDQNVQTLGPQLASERGIAAYGQGAYSQFQIDRRSIAAVALDTSHRLAFLPLLDGRAPIADDEIVLGAKTMRSLGVHVGGTLRVTAPGGSRTFKIVGKAVFPRFSPYPGAESTGLGVGAATTLHAVQSLDAKLGSSFFLVEAKPGVDVASQLAKSAVFPGDLVASGIYVHPQRPNDVLSYNRLTRTPLVLAAVLGLLAVGSTVHLLVTSVRNRRRDLALLKTFGLTRRRILVTVLVQATTLTVCALIVAIPAGALAGRWLWIVTARWLGIADDLALPVLPLLGVAGAALVGAAAIATGPGFIATRIRPAFALRSE